MLYMFCLIHMCAFVAEISRRPPENKCSLSEARTTKIYKKGFLGLIDFNYNGPKVITEEERDELKDYVSQHYDLGGNFDKDSIEYQEILETVKRFTPETNSLPRQKGIKKITKRVGKHTIKKQNRHVFPRLARVSQVRPHQKRPKRQRRFGRS